MSTLKNAHSLISVRIKVKTHNLFNSLMNRFRKNSAAGIQERSQEEGLRNLTASEVSSP